MAGTNPRKATYKIIEDAICPYCGEISDFRSDSAAPHVIYRCLNPDCGNGTLTYEEIQERNPDRQIKAIGRA